MTRLALLSVIATALVVQLALGTDPILVALCGLALIVGLFPALVFRPDLYGVLAAFFAIRYVGAALIAKTWLLQPLDLYLNAPVAAYSLSCLLMFVVVGVILTVRAFDRGTTLVCAAGHGRGHPAPWPCRLLDRGSCLRRVRDARFAGGGGGGDGAVRPLRHTRRHPPSSDSSQKSCTLR